MAFLVTHMVTQVGKFLASKCREKANITIAYFPHRIQTGTRNPVMEYSSAT